MSEFLNRGVEYLQQEVERFQREHEAVLVREGDREAEIDIKIAPLIREIWRADIDTTMSCEDAFDGLIWVEFPSEEDLLSFLHIALHYQSGADSMYNRAVGLSPHSNPEPHWQFSISPVDLARHECDCCGEEFHEGEPELCFEYSVYFPASDLPVVLERLCAYNNKKRVVTCSPRAARVQDLTLNVGTSDSAVAQ